MLVATIQGPGPRVFPGTPKRPHFLGADEPTCPTWTTGTVLAVIAALVVGAAWGYGTAIGG